MEFNDLEIEKAYRVLAPRPTIIVTTANSKGESNAAPFSFTMPVSVKPALVAFASVPSHHTYKNIEETGEFVVNIPNEAILEKLWITGEKFPYGVSEIEESGLTQMESLKVSAPKIAECIAHMKLPNAFNGKWFVLFSHPADFTPVCTTEFVAFQKRYDKFRKLNCELIGLSVDQVFSHLKWIEWIGENIDTEIEFPVIADTGAVANTLGLIHPAKATNTVRAVFIVDPEGILRAMLYYPQELGRNM